MSEPTYYIRARGVISGPFRLEQLQAMRRQEKLARFHEVSTDGKTWVGASTVAELFPASASQSTKRAWKKTASDPARSAVEGAPASEPAIERVLAPDGWFFASGDQPVGPIPLDELKRRAARGDVTTETLVWVEGMPSWSPYGEVTARALAAAAALPATASTHSTNEVTLTPVGPGARSGKRVCGLAIVSLVLGLTGWVCGVGSLIALILGVVALGRITGSQGRLEGRSLAITGLVLGALGLVVFIATVVFIAMSGQTP